MEYRHPQDDAWYDVTLICDGDTLSMKYDNFAENYTETVHVDKFKTMEELEDFEERFRPSSVQLQDSECFKIVQGKTVCGSYVFQNDELKFYDALVVELLNEKHTFEEGEEVCSCKYVLKWQQGPLHGRRTFASISDICLTPSNKKVLPELAVFFEKARMRLEHNYDIGSEDDDDDDDVDDDDAADDDDSVFKTTGIAIMKSKYLEAFYLKLGGRRKIRSAFRTVAGRMDGTCKKS